jgi:Uma2 family endonuclease
MATASLERPAVAVTFLPEGEPYRMTAEEFFHAVEAGVFPPDRRLGLWEGQLYEKMAKKLAHAASSEMARLALSRVLPEGWSLWGENPILVDNITAPLPDLTVVRGAPIDYFRRNSVPKAPDIGLVVELADATLKRNLKETLAKYAASGLPAYWVVNLVDRRIECFTDPQPAAGTAAFARAERFGPGEEVPLVLDGREVARVPVNDLLPEPRNPTS